ncbi:hypothetical protein [Actinomyces lilanjuaniae]|uniref:hypothetical protein n=1 Tax=Actinomyces lilanjuaniae TaxID=2321394 RepID=UPI0013C4C9B8|nr:hypothetical protein [Actinomyces lilanjuaniae]
MSIVRPTAAGGLTDTYVDHNVKIYDAFRAVNAHAASLRETTRRPAVSSVMDPGQGG